MYLHIVNCSGTGYVHVHQGNMFTCNCNDSNVIFPELSTYHTNQRQRNIVNDRLCIGCNLKEESGQEILDCKNFGENKENLAYNMFFSDLVSTQLVVGNTDEKTESERQIKRRGYLKILI